MTRKRFIKLLMAHGESKHKAQAIAYLYNASGKSYKDAYCNYCARKLFSVSATCQKLSANLVNLCRSIRELAKNFKLLNHHHHTEVDNG